MIVLPNCHDILRVEVDDLPGAPTPPPPPHTAAPAHTSTPPRQVDPYCHVVLPRSTPYHRLRVVTVRKDRMPEGYFHHTHTPRTPPFTAL